MEPGRMTRSKALEDNSLHLKIQCLKVTGKKA
jgi:hypothetical protein